MTNTICRPLALTLATIALVIAATASSAQATLVAHWPLNDGPAGSPVTGANDVIDYAGHPATDATAQGTGGTWVNDPVRGIVFSTTEDDRLNAGTQGIDRNVGFTWSVWANLADSNETDSGADVLLGTRAASGGVWHKLDAVQGVGNWAGISGASMGDITDDTWRQIVYLGDSTSTRLYVDGVLKGSDATTPTSTFNGVFSIGGSNQFSEDVLGLISDVAIWEDALTADEVTSFFEISSGTGLLYDAGEFDLLKEIHDAGTGLVEIGRLRWTYANGLAGPAGLSGANNDYDLALVLDANAGSGLTAVLLPEPSSIAIWSLIGLGLVGFGVHRRGRK